MGRKAKDGRKLKGSRSVREGGREGGREGSIPCLSFHSW
jgi:hypothetical protein